ncbi:MAG: aminoacyl-tRNA hydrolase [Calditrichaeota bacterium]|nr:MAG: aminoacyl-tRNA hydrolase [Calditrichota bacterium]
MYLICGLGNPGPKYEFTRHNMGFMVIDELARRNSLSFRSGKGNYLYSKYIYQAKNIILLKPMSFMNLSGEAVRHAADYWDVEPGNILIITDDYNIPFTHIRIREKGRDGGHNGLASVFQCMGTSDIPRLRLGIGSDHSVQDSAKFVLSQFSAAEKKSLGAFSERAADAVQDFIETDIIHAMNSFNQN